MPTSKPVLLIAAACLCACGSQVRSVAVHQQPSPSPLPSPTLLPPSPTPTASEGDTAPAPVAHVGPLPGQNLPLSGPLPYPLLIQVENTAPARPQVGIAAGSVIFQYLVEGGITRFSVLYHRVPGVVGPVRSARFISVYLYERFSALLMASGGSKYTYQRIFASGIPAIINDFDHGRHFFRWSGRAAPHNLYTSQASMTGAGTVNARPPRAGDFPRGASWAGTEPAAVISVAAHRTTFTWDSGGYDVVSDGDALTDMAFGRVRPVSVAVLHVRQWVVQDIVDSTGSSVRDYDLNAGGAAEFYANGTVIRGSWASGGESAPLVFNDAGGHQLLMPSGLLFVSVAP